MILAEDLLLLLTDDHTGKLAASGSEVDVALGGALLVELTLIDRVDVAGCNDRVRKGRRLVVRLYERLVEAGVLRTALREGATTVPRTGALISLLVALKAVHKVVDPSSVGLSKRELNAKAKRIAEGDWTAEAVRRGGSAR